MITNKQLLAFTQLVGDIIGKELEKDAFVKKVEKHFNVCPKEATELVTLCEELEYIERTDSGYLIKTV